MQQNVSLAANLLASSSQNSLLLTELSPVEVRNVWVQKTHIVENFPNDWRCCKHTHFCIRSYSAGTCPLCKNRSIWYAWKIKYKNLFPARKTITMTWVHKSNFAKPTLSYNQQTSEIYRQAATSKNVLVRLLRRRSDGNLHVQQQQSKRNFPAISHIFWLKPETSFGTNNIFNRKHELHLVILSKLHINLWAPRCSLTKHIS